eukprot:scaffold397_cov403-Prasinococcus_capsulatus_cf.AAC.3
MRLLNLDISGVDAWRQSQVAPRDELATTQVRWSTALGALDRPYLQSTVRIHAQSGIQSVAQCYHCVHSPDGAGHGPVPLQRCAYYSARLSRSLVLVGNLAGQGALKRGHGILGVRGHHAYVVIGL